MRYSNKLPLIVSHSIHTMAHCSINLRVKQKDVRALYLMLASRPVAPRNGPATRNEQRTKPHARIIYQTHSTTYRYYVEQMRIDITYT